jgi:excisionase family DNA binding protein
MTTLDDNGPSPFRLLLDMQEVAEACNVSLSTVRRWVSSGYLRPVDLPNLSRRKLFRRDAVLAFIASCPDEVSS